MNKESNQVANALKEWILRHEKFKREEPYIKYANGTTKNFNDVLKDIELENEAGMKFVNNVISVAITAIHANEPKKPPRLRPMSELPESNEYVNILIQHDGKKFWGDGFVCLNRVELRYLGQDLWKNTKWKSELGVQAIGWIPKETLPDPNEIKL